MTKPLVSIIVPIFNVGKYIEKCVHSLMTQKYENIEYIFVDDASEDDSATILSKVLIQYPERNHAVKIIRHELNRGLPAARNTGLRACNGEYIFHCDSDDWIESDMILEMVNEALDCSADIVYSDFYLTFSQSDRYMKQPALNEAFECIRLMLQGRMKYNVWNKLIKKSLYIDNNITFPEGRGMGEDMTIVKLFVHSEKVSYIPKAYYHYMQINTSAFTKTYSQKHLDDMIYNSMNLENYLKSEGLSKEFELDLNFFKLNLKLPFLITENRNMYSLWRNWFPEANKYIAKNPSFSLRIKFLQYLAIYKVDWLVWLYNIILNRVVYGMIYR